MPTWNHRLWRIARRLETAYCESRNRPRRHILPEMSWNDVHHQLRRLAVAESHGWRAAAHRQREATAVEMDCVVRRLQELTGELREDRTQELPSLRTIYEELVAVHEQFGIEVEAGLLSVTTEPIVLEGIRLGRFAIRLDIDHIGGETPYGVTALEPNPAATSSEVTHPHISDEVLCAGEGRQPIAAALAEGRLYDFFVLVNQILKNYAAGSAFVELDRWHGAACDDCDYQLDEDDTHSCYACEKCLCCDCLVCCGNCHTGYCSGCLDRCTACDEYHCSNCLVPCEQCRRDVCLSCREDDSLCPTCREELEDETEEQPDDTPVETTQVSTEPAI